MVCSIGDLKKKKKSNSIVYYCAHWQPKEQAHNCAYSTHRENKLLRLKLATSYRKQVVNYNNQASSRPGATAARSS